MQIFIYILCLSESTKIFTILLMVKQFIFSAVIIGLISMSGNARAAARASDYVSANTYNNLYPYMNNTMRTNLNPGVSPSQSNAQINVLTRTKSNGTTTRNVVPRRATTANATTTRRVAARTNTSTTARAGTTSAARSATNKSTTARAATPTNTRRVTARSGTTTGTAVQSANRASRTNGGTTVSRNDQTATYTTTGEAISSSRCMADYTECMDNYCLRQDAEYNRCYCSSQLAQIDAKHKPKIDQLIKEILTLQSTNYWTDEEMHEYWEDTIVKYTGENSWHNLEDALDIDWASTASTVRGQQAFAMGHQYCVQHLQGCAYMQTNMRDAYRSEIARDCAAYETSLLQLENAAESIVEAYK